MGKTVVLTKSEVDEIIDFANKMAIAKAKEEDHKIDNDWEVKRHITGYSGEMAVEKLLGIKFSDHTIGDSSNYAGADIKELNIGVKTVGFGKAHVIRKRNTYPQILCFASEVNKDGTVVVELIKKI